MTKEKETKKKKGGDKSHDPKKYINLQPSINEDDLLVYYALEGQFENFLNHLPEGIDVVEAEDIFDEINLTADDVLDERVMSQAERRKRGQSMRRNRAKIAAARRRSKKRRATPEKLKQRARRSAINKVKKKLAGGKSYSSLSSGQKRAIDKRAQKKKSQIDRLAKKELRTARKRDRGQLKNSYDPTLDEGKRFHKMYKNNEPEVNIDHRFKMYREKELPFIEDDIDELILDMNSRTNEIAEEFSVELADVRKLFDRGIIEWDESLESSPNDFAEEYTLYMIERDTSLRIPKNGKRNSRKDMPQIKSYDVKDFLSFLKKEEGVSHDVRKIDASKLKPTQNQFHKQKIRGMMKSLENSEMDEKPIVVSKDHYVIDGHHRWLAYLNLDMEIPVYYVKMDAKELLDAMKEYPKSFTSKLYESFLSEDECKIITRKEMKEFEKLANRLFDKFGIEFDFTNHFRERMSDKRNNPCIDLKEIAEIIKRIYMRKKQGQETLSRFKNAEVVLHSLQSDLNIPVAIEYDRRNDDLTVIGKTIMRKKNFKSRDQKIKV